MKVRAYWADVEVEWKLEVLLVLGHRSLIKKIRIHLQVPESFVFWVTWDKSLFGVVLFPVFYFFCFTWAYVICAPVPAERSENYTYLVFKNCNGHFWKCMWTSIRNVKFLKNALEYNVYHRCLCNFLNQTMISFEVFLSLFRLIFLHQKRRFRPRNFQFSSLEHTKRKLLRLLSKFISLQWSLVCSLVEIRCNIVSCLFCICFGDHLTILRMQSSKTPLVWSWYCTGYL